MRVALGFLVLAACASFGCGGKPPPEEQLIPRLEAVESCAHPSPNQASIPVPVRPPEDPYRLPVWAAIGVRDVEGFHAGTFLCDLPSRILVLDAQQTVSGGKRVTGGTAWSIARPGGGAAKPVPILGSSKGCIAGEITCSWATASPDAPSIDTIRGPQWVATSGWVHGVEDMCRALPDDTIAVCSTAQRMAYVELGCTPPGAPVKLQLGLHDESLPRNYDLDVEVPNLRLYGSADPPAGDRWTYRFTGAGDTKGHGRAATLAIDLGTQRGELVLDGQREECIAFGLYRR